MHFGNIDKIYAGTDSVSKVFLGTDLVWPYTPPVPPTGESGYYYYYQSESGMTNEEALEAFDTEKIQGPAVSAGQFTFRVYVRYSGGTEQEVASVVCFAIPSNLSISNVSYQDFEQAPWIDITSEFTVSVPITIGDESYNLFYHRYVFSSTDLFRVITQ